MILKTPTKTRKNFVQEFEQNVIISKGFQNNSFGLVFGSCYRELNVNCFM